jgi:sporulation protein YlmC with PRC-barrel domain
MTDTRSTSTHTLLALKDTPMSVEPPADDIRGREVLDRDGEKIGKVDDLMIDEQEKKVRFLKVAHGGFLGIGTEHFLVPAEAVTAVREDSVSIDRTRKDLGNVPGYSPDLAAEENYYPDVYGYWGGTPFWSGGYAGPNTPGFPMAPIVPHN